MVRAFDRATSEVAWSQPVQLPAQVLHLLLLDSDRQGMIYLAALVGIENPEPPFQMTAMRIVALRFGAGGAARGVMELPALPPNADENFRPLSVDDDGTIYALRAAESGVEVVAYRFP